MSKDRIIGSNGTMPWHIPEEARLFRDITMGNTVIMGRNTWLSLPERFRPLPDRVNIIVSATIGRQEGAIVCTSVDAAIKEAASHSGEAFCIGGAKLFDEMLPLSDVLHISWIKADYQGDTRFPEINFNEWRVVESKEYKEFTYKKYLRSK
ncbi:MAG: dihydrofolate reductase [Nitrososphaerota archaeon]|nr:dihydrofolate reductase [Nitrososphaerota archaeon]